MTVTLEQIEENMRHLLHEWPKDDGIPFPREVLDTLEELKAKVRSRDEEKAQKTKPLTMANPPAEIPDQQANATQEGQVKGEPNEERTMMVMYTDAHPTEESTGQMTPFNWAKDIDESISLSPAISMDTKSTMCIDKAMAEAPAVPTLPVEYSPHDLSALCSGTRNPWGTLSCCHHHHHHSQPPCNPSAINSAPQAPWNGDHHCRPCFYLSCLPPPHFDPVHIIEMVHHPWGITPTKPVVHTTSPIRHNVPPAPIQLVKAAHHPQEMKKPSGPPPRPPLLAIYPPFIIQCHCSTTLPVQQE